jgi:hypothetical protein
MGKNGYSAERKEQQIISYPKVFSLIFTFSPIPTIYPQSFFLLLQMPLWRRFRK